LVENETNKSLQTFLNILSLIITFSLLYSLFLNVEKVTNGDHSSKIIIIVLVECLAVFIIPFLFNPKYFSKRSQKPNPSKDDKEKQYLMKIIKGPKLNVRYSKDIIRKCPKCKFQNPHNTHRCLNCNELIDFIMPNKEKF
jgi:hypothetical protein